VNGLAFGNRNGQFDNDLLIGGNQVPVDASADAAASLPSM
jgi:hypothetical protein